MKKVFILVLAITIFTILLGINVYGDHFVDSETGLKVQSTNENALNDWNKVVLRKDNGSFITIEDTKYLSFTTETSDLDKINYHILKGDRIFFRFYIKYWEEVDGYQTYSFSINKSTDFSTNGYDSREANGLEYYRGAAGTTVGAFYIDDTVTDGEIQYQLSDEKIDEKIDGYEYIGDFINSLVIQLSAKGKDADTWHLQYLELQYRIFDESKPEITSGSLYNPDTLEYLLESNEAFKEYSVDNGDNWASIDNPVTSTSIYLNKGLNEIKVKDQAGNISDVNSFYANTIKIVNTFDAYSKLYDGTTAASVYNDSTTISGVHDSHDVSLNKIFSFSSSDVGNSIEVDLKDSYLSGAEAALYVLDTDTSPTTTADIYDKLSWNFDRDYSNDQSESNYDFTQTNGAQQGQYEGRNSVKFERNNEQYLITNNDNDLLPAGSDFTYSVWYYLNESIINSNRYFVIESSGYEKYPMSYGLKNDDLISKGQVFTNNKATANSFYLDKSSGSYGADTGKWYNITVTYDRISDTHTAYLNGIESGSIVVPVMENIEKLILGACRKVNYENWDGVDGRFWDGYIDNLSVWGRVLSESEIDTIQNDNIYTISFNGNGSTGGSVPSEELYEKGTTFDIPTDTPGLSREGYVFTGWNTEADGTGDSLSFTVHKDTTLYAQWDYIGEFKVSDYGTGQDAKYRWYRGYLFQVNQETTLTSLIGGGNGGVFAGGIYSVDGFTVNIDGSISGNVNPKEVLGSVEFTGTDPNQVVSLDSEVTLQPDTYYLIASGRKSQDDGYEKDDPYHGYGYVVKNIDVNNLESGSTVINTWLPKSTGATNTAIQYKYYDASPSAILNMTHSITEDLPMLGFQYITNVNLPYVETKSANATTSSAVINGKLTSTGGGETGVYFEIGTSMDLSSDGTLHKANSLSAPSTYSFTIDSLTEDVYHYRAVAVNEAGRSEGSLQYFYKPYIINYHLDGGTNHISNPETTPSNDEDVTLSEPTKTGYKFVGWFDAENGGNRVTSISKETSSIDLYARWNLAPVAGSEVPSIYYIDEGDSADISLIGYDPDGDDITYEITINPDFGSLSSKGDGVYTYTHDGSENFSDSISYKVNDGKNDSDNIAEIDIIINPVNDPPTEPGEFIEPSEDSYKRGDTVSLEWGSSSDVENDKITYDVDYYTESTGYINISENLTATSTDFTIPMSGAEKIKFRVRAFDGEDYSTYTESSYVNIYYEVTFKDYDGSFITTESGLNITPPSPTREGYTFDKWDGSYANLTADKTLTAVYKANSDTEYKLKHYLETLDGNYELKETESLTGKTDTIATAVAKDYTGFSENADAEGTAACGNIEPDGTRVLKLYYQRNKYNIIYNTDGGTLINSDSVLYEQNLTSFTLPVGTTKPGYTFEGWTPILPDAMPAEDLILTAQWLAEEDTKYTVEHYQQNIKGNDYTHKDSYVYGGETDTQATALALNYDGFYFDEDNDLNSKEGNIEGDGSLVLKLYYNREEYTVNFLNHEDELLKTERVRYQGNANPPTPPARRNYTFRRWNGEYTDITQDTTLRTVYARIISEEPEEDVKEEETQGEIKEEVEEINDDQESKYLKTKAPLPKDSEPSKVTTAVFIQEDGTKVHIPTKVYEEDGIWYAETNSFEDVEVILIKSKIEVESVEEHWSEEAVEDMASRLIIKNPEKFKPDAEISRGEFAEYITKALGIYRTEKVETMQFEDVDLNEEISDAVGIAAEYGIINGYPDNTFRPEEKISREEAMVMYARAIKVAEIQKIDKEKIQYYLDEEEVSDWAYESVRETIGSGIFNGRTPDSIVPKGTFTKAEAATAVRNLLIKAGLINE